MDTFKALDGYNKKTVYTVRHFTIDDIKAMLTGYQSEYHILDKLGNVRRCRPNGKLKTWKKDPLRFERGFKYGLYENFRLDTAGMLSELVHIVNEENSHD